VPGDRVIVRPLQDGIAGQMSLAIDLGLPRSPRSRSSSWATRMSEIEVLAMSARHLCSPHRVSLPLQEHMQPPVAEAPTLMSQAPQPSPQLGIVRFARAIPHHHPRTAQAVSRVFGTFLAERRLALAQAVMAPLICWSFSSSMFRYLLLDHAVPAMCREPCAGKLEGRLPIRECGHPDLAQAGCWCGYAASAPPEDAVVRFSSNAGSVSIGFQI
jgi:hypothetical protein